MRQLLIKLKNSVAAMTLVAMMLIATAVKASEACQLWYVERDVLTGKLQTCILTREVSGPISICAYSCSQ